LESPARQTALKLIERVWLDRARGVLPVSDEKFREITRQEPLDARQTYSTDESQRKSPNIGDENRSPDFSMVLNLNRNFTLAHG